jgi:phosphate butyryltransferase
MKINNFFALRERAQKLGPQRLAVVAADEITITAAAMAGAEGIVKAFLIGDADDITSTVQAVAGKIGLQTTDFEVLAVPAASQAAQTAVELARNGAIDLIIKGRIRTDQLLKAVLHKESGLRTGRLLSDVLIYEDVLSRSGEKRFVAVTDGGINVQPSLEQIEGIIANAVQVMHALGFRQPKVALMSATEAVSEAVPSTIAARRITQLYRSQPSPAAEVFGPLALDNALLASAARAKGIASGVAGRADVLVVPNIEAGNLLGKAVKYLAGSLCAHIVVGAALPVLIPSRVESADDKLNSIALGVVVNG